MRQNRNPAPLAGGGRVWDYVKAIKLNDPINSHSGPETQARKLGVVVAVVVCDIAHRRLVEHVHALGRRATLELLLEIADGARQIGGAS